MKVFIATIIIICLGLVNTLFAQSKFSKLSSPEKHWVLAHPFVAKKAFRITKEVQQVVDSIQQLRIIGIDSNGGKLDAFKHAYWMASLTNSIGKRKAKKLGTAHEKGNFLQYKKHESEDRILPDSVSSEMDLKNNDFGISLLNNCKKLSLTDIQNKILTALQEGKLYVIKKDANGNYVTCNSELIDLKKWIGKWDVPKCLIPSNE